MRKRLAIGGVLAVLVALAACDGTAGDPTRVTASKKPKSSSAASPKASPRGSATPSPGDQGGGSPSPSPKASGSPSPQASGSPGPKPSGSASASPTASATPSTSPSPTPSGSVKPSSSPSPSPSASVKPSASPSASPTATPSPSPSPSATGSLGPFAAVFTVGKKFNYEMTVETAGASALKGTMVWEVLEVNGTEAEVKSTTTLPGQAPNTSTSPIDLTSSNPFASSSGPTPGPETSEAVTVPAGTFDCTKTHSAGTLPDDQGELESGDTWFNTTQGMVKQVNKIRISVPGFPTGIVTTSTVALKSIE